MSDENTQIEKPSGTTARRRPLYIVISVVGALLVVVLAYILLANRESGRVVPAPRTVSFGVDLRRFGAGDEANQRCAFTSPCLGNLAEHWFRP